MSTMKLEDDLKTALRELKFKIAANKETARISGEMILGIIEPERGSFQLHVVLPSGEGFVIELSRDALLKAVDPSYVGRDAEWDAACDRVGAQMQAAPQESE